MSQYNVLSGFVQLNSNVNADGDSLSYNHLFYSTDYYVLYHLLMDVNC